MRNIGSDTRTIIVRWNIIKTMKDTIKVTSEIVKDQEKSTDLLTT
jgi:hypothetical protein